MMKNKLILSIFFVISIFTSNYGQTTDGYTLGVTEFIRWISDLEKVLKNVTDEEKLKAIDRQLGYIRYDLNSIAWKKTYLSEMISNHMNEIKDGDLDSLDPMIHDLEQDIQKLISSLLSIKGKLSQSDQEIVNSIIEEVHKILKFKSESMIGWFYRTTPLEQILEEAKQARELADEATKKIDDARKLIKALLK